MARYDDLNTRAIAYTTFVSSILLIIIILLGRALCYTWIESEDQRKLAEAHYITSDQAISEQKAAIAKYERSKVEIAPADNGSTDPNQKLEPLFEDRLHIPVDDAKKIILEELKSPPQT
jgi:hypothetical protein